MSYIKLPTVGRIVHFYPNGHLAYAKAANNNASFVPAVVTQTFGGTMANLTIFPVGENPMFGWSVPHQSEANEDGVFWAFPEIK